MSALTASTIRIGRRYRANRLAGPYDAVVIGSGIGGLTTAALLSALGWKVCVLEQHYTAGGYTHSYDRNGYEWDVGVHYIGDVGTKSQARRLFDFISGGQLQWAPMDAEYDRFYIGDQVYSAVAGKQAFRDNLVGRFPREQKAIDRYVQMLEAVGKAVPIATMGRLLKPWQRKLAKPLIDLLTPNYLYRTTWSVLSELTQDHDLIAVLCGQWGDMGLPPKKSAFLVHALIARHYLWGGYYPVGGSWRIADTIIPQIQKSGGEVFTYARVRRIVVENGVTRGVEMEDGTRIDCACVVSSAGVFNTFGRLLEPADVRRAGYDKLLTRLTPSIAHLGVYIGLKGTAEELGLPKTNFWIYPDNDYDTATERFLNDRNAPFPVVYISFPSAKDPDYARRRPGTSTIEIVAPAPYEWFDNWKDQPWGKRGDDYDACKNALGERLMAVLYDKLPQLKGKVDYHEVSTPLSSAHFCAWRRGELYGLDHDPQRFREDRLSPRTEIPGLWLTGQDVVSCGVVGAMMAGMLTATAILGLRQSGPLMKRIFASP